MSDAAFAVRMAGLEKSFEKGGRTIHVLRGINLELDQGDRISIMGRSGVGKSTLLHILGGLDRPTSGTITIGGQDLADMDDRDASALRSNQVGFVFQFHHLLPEFTALENVMMPSVVGGTSFDVARRTATDVLAEVGLTERLDHRPGELSGGEQQRVAIARALAHRPALVLADEPTGNLDQQTGASVYGLLLEAVQQRGAILVLVTHDAELADLLPRRMLLQDGYLVDRK
jgi:lipoprotein-releasing system ATP-binding protein